MSTPADEPDMRPDIDPPSGPERPARYSPYAVPLSTLLAGAYVASTEQVQLQPVSSPPETLGGHDLGGGADGGGADGDGD